MKYLLILVLCLCSLIPARLYADGGVDLKSIHKILILGDSITHHAPAPELGWSGDWGMAATAADKDYVHQFLAKLNEARGTGTPTPDVWIFAEGGGKVTDKVPFTNKISAYQADLALVQLGENDKQALTVEGFQQPYEQLLAAIRAGNPNARILCCGVWGLWPKAGDHTKDTMISAACQKYGATFVDLGGAFADTANRAAAENLYTNPGVNWHPSDSGMTAYANAFWQALTGAPSAPPVAADTTPAPAPAASPTVPPVSAATPAPAAAPDPTTASAPASVPSVEVNETWNTPPDNTWVPVPATAQDAGHNVAKITSTADGSMFVLPLQAAQFAGQVVTIKTRIKADAVSEPPKPWNGVKIMFRVRDAEGKQDFPQFRLPGGTFDWRDINWTVRIPENTVYLEFDIGLEKVTGTAYFDAIHISAGK